MAAAPEAGEPGKGKPFKLLGILDVENIPCARDSTLYGSLGSVVAGLGHFLLTSRIRRSCDVGIGGFILVTLGCWFHCRYNYAKLRIQERLAREGIKNKILYESTHLDPERKQTNSGSSSSN
ncbi:cytochrome c oxidase assembly protein COX20, mitochondrial isoform X2 [Balaenoptera acutorostrata]|uniref:Cytochrome c oxidase assembly protein COX20, mitochondrial n=3 Tax=Mysticeti TaxID=9761 RepID=A0A8B8YWY0_BALMU|nr:cytochrome c oxidase assembly protein COX20, mitochondrial isoform X1 [Balaenoptera musculus]XP_057387985.1 cytochrome c oxidase assembly protein COX20, mitochondrial isoform X2 [Balaenoptera acutorostrata]